MFNDVMTFYETSRFAYYYIIIVGMAMGVAAWEGLKYIYKQVYSKLEEHFARKEEG